MHPDQCTLFCQSDTKKRIAILTLAALVLAGYGTRTFCLGRSLEKAREAREQQRQAAIKARIVAGRRIITEKQFQSQFKKWESDILTKTNWDNLVEAFKNASEWANEIRPPRFKTKALGDLSDLFSLQLYNTHKKFFTQLEQLPITLNIIAKNIEKAAAQLEDLLNMQRIYKEQEKIFIEANNRIRQLPQSLARETETKVIEQIISADTRAKEAFIKKTGELINKQVNKLQGAQAYANRVPFIVKGKGSIETVKNTQKNLLELFEPFVELDKKNKDGKMTLIIKELDLTLAPSWVLFMAIRNSAVDAAKKAWRAIQLELWGEEIPGEEETKPTKEEEELFFEVD